MYPEFIIIYVMLFVVIVLLAGVIYFLMKLLKSQSGGPGYNGYDQNTTGASQYYDQSYQQSYQNQYQNQAPTGSVVFCKYCATQFDASQMNCPNCGTRR